MEVVHQLCLEVRDDKITGLLGANNAEKARYPPEILDVFWGIKA